MSTRSSLIAGLLIIELGMPARTSAQSAIVSGPIDESVLTSPLLVADDLDPQQKPEPPPAAIGEEGKKPTRGFFSALVHNLGDDVKHLPRRSSLISVGLGAAVAVAVHPADEHVNAKLAGTADGVWGPGHIIGITPTILSAATATYIVGRATNAPRAQHLGMDEIEAALITSSIVYAIKQTVRRPRPLDNDGNPQSGFAFPSGHSAASFAAATVLQQHLGYKAGLPTYLVATYVAISRLHDNKHWASDVAMGAGIGVAVGRSVTWHGRHFYGSPLLLPDGAGVLLAMRTGS